MTAETRRAAAQLAASTGFGGRGPGPAIPGGHKWGDNRTGEEWMDVPGRSISVTCSLSCHPWQSVPLLSALTRQDRDGYNVCPRNSPFIPKQAVLPEPWWGLLGEAQARSVVLQAAPVSMPVAHWWAPHPRGCLEHGPCHLGPVPSTYTSHRSPHPIKCLPFQKKEKKERYVQK